MANRIDIDAFVNYWNIPNTTKTGVGELLESEITILQDKFFNEVFGYGFQKTMLANATDPRFVSILDGEEYTDTNGHLQKWIGVNTPLTNYVYYYFLKRNLQKLVDVGFIYGKPENSNMVTIVVKPNQAFNTMVDELEKLRGYFIANESDYENDDLVFCNYAKVNNFGI